MATDLSRISPAARGVWGEEIAAAWLTAQGKVVAFAAGSHSPFDLVSVDPSDGSVSLFDVKVIEGRKSGGTALTKKQRMMGVRRLIVDHGARVRIAPLGTPRRQR